MKIHGIYIGEVVITLNCDYVEGMKPLDSIKEAFVGDAITSGIQEILNDEFEVEGARVEVYKKCADVKFEDENNGKV